jgi:hypothetical protein
MFDPRRTPWLIDESEFYELEDARSQKEFLLRYAVLAPSGHNTQPWTFRITENAIEVRPDWSRNLPVCDPDNRELLLSVGAAIANLRVAAAHFGFDTAVQYDDVITVSLHETCDADASLRRLFGAVTKRRTHRSAFERRELEPETLDRICDLVESADQLRFVVPHELPHLGALVEQADLRLLSDGRWRDELAAWIRPNETSEGDGITGDAFGIPGPLSALAPYIVRNVDVGESRGRNDRKLVEQAAGLIVVTSADDRVALLRAGEVLERLLLTLTLLGVQYAFVNQVIEVPELRRELWKLMRTATPPQLLLRIGYASRVTTRPMPRRPLNAVL